jgi:hypothetical protein
MEPGNLPGKSRIVNRKVRVDSLGKPLIRDRPQLDRKLFLRGP